MPLIVLLRKQKDNMSQDGVPALMVSDMVTMLTAMLEQKMYTNRADPMLAFRFTLVGLVSRIVEAVMQKNLPSGYGDPHQSKNQIVVFIMNVLVSMMADKRASHLGMGMKGVNADLLAKWITDIVMTDSVLFSFPTMGS